MSRACNSTMFRRKFFFVYDVTIRVCKIYMWSEKKLATYFLKILRCWLFRKSHDIACNKSCTRHLIRLHYPLHYVLFSFFMCVFSYLSINKNVRAYSKRLQSNKSLRHYDDDGDNDFFLILLKLIRQSVPLEILDARSKPKPLTQTLAVSREAPLSTSVGIVTANNY